MIRLPSKSRRDRLFVFHDLQSNRSEWITMDDGDYGLAGWGLGERVPETNRAERGIRSFEEVRQARPANNNGPAIESFFSPAWSLGTHVGAGARCVMDVELPASSISVADVTRVSAAP